MSSVDNRVVKMAFDNASFERNAQTSIHTIDQLKKSLDFSGATKGMEQIESSARGVDLSQLAANVQSLSDRFSAFGIAGMEVFRRLTDSAINFATNLASNVIDPIVEGGKNRAFAIENARFSLQGLISDEQEVKDIMDDALASVDGTAYAYNDAASAAAQFAATGLRSGEEMQQTLRGIAGVAATTNSEYSEISHIFTTVAGNGRLMTEQLNQFSYRGMNAAASLTNAFNDVLNGSSNLSEEMQQHIRDLVQYGSEEIKDFSGSLQGITESDLRALVSAGEVDFKTFSQIMATTFGDHAKDANKTFEGSMSNIRSALARTGAMFYEGLIVQEGPLVGMFNSVRLAINEFNKTLKPLAELWTNAVNTIATRAGDIIDTFVDNDGIAAIGPVIEYVVDAIRKFGAIFSEVFGLGNVPLIGIIANAAISFKNWAESLKVTDEQLGMFRYIMTAVKKAFDGIVSVGATVFGIIKSIGSAFFEVFDASNVVTMIMSVVSRFKTFTEAIRPTGEQLDKLKNFFVGLFTVIREVGWVVLDFINNAWDNLGRIISEFLPTGDSFYDTLSNIGDILKSVGDKISNFFNNEDVSIFEEGLSGVTDKIIEFIQAAKEFLHLDELGEKFSNFIQSIKDSLSGESDFSFFDRFSGVLERIKEAISYIAPIVKEKLDILREGLANFVKGVSSEAGKFDGFDIIGALGLGAGGAGIYQISKMLKPVGDTLKEVGSWKDHLLDIKDALIDTFGAVQQNLKADALKNIALSIGILAASLFIISLIDTDKLIGSLAALSALMYEVNWMLNNLSGISGKAKNMVGAASLLIGMATAIAVLAVAMRIIGTMDTKDIMKGLLAVTILIAELTGVATAMSKVGGKMTKGATGLIAMAIALTILTISVKILGSMDLDSLIRGLGSVTILLVALAAAAALIGQAKFGVSAGLGLIAMAGALIMLSKPVKELGALDINTLAKGLGSVAVMLLALAAAALAMPKGMVKIGVGMLAMAGAIMVMAQAVKMLGELSVEQLAKGLISLGVAVALLAIAANAMKTALPGAAAFLIMAAAIVPLALSLKLLSSIGIFELITALVGLAAGIAILGIASTVLAPMAPAMLAVAGALTLFGIAAMLFAGAFALVGLAVATGGTAMLLFIRQVIALLPFLGQMLGELIINLATTVAEGAPAIGEALKAMIETILSVVGEEIPNIVNTLLELLMTLLNSLLEYVPQMADVGLQIIEGFLRAIADNIEGIVEAGMDIIINFIKGVSEKLPEVIDAAFKLIIGFINGLADAIRDNHNDLYDAVGNLIDSIVEAVADLAWKVFDAGANLVQGFIDGLTSMPGQIWEAACGLATDAWNAITGTLDEHSPSRLTYKGGEYFTQGFINGILSLKDKAADESANVALAAMDAFDAAIDSDYQPTITPIMDLSNIQNGIGAMDGMFGGLPSTYGINGSIDARNAAQMQAMNMLGAGSDYSSILEGMLGLRGDLAKYSEMLSKLQIVMDTGVMVGALTPGIDRQLGRNAVLAGRGV